MRSQQIHVVLEILNNLTYIDLFRMTLQSLKTSALAFSSLDSHVQKLFLRKI
ncbi:hypothetical protein J5N97_026812 [Dioscorea zingiberensis]|uniref:Uncharacterized protein n=1 Tax=Dioscorea zingiberensis TaxID=325984 RepID=A0A9D5H721_9LILI|nr:hypothetical protein J5N97_026812 [Dioscorea zingiberensis]